MYEDVISQITQRLQLKDAISKASRAMADSKKSQKEDAPSERTIITSMSKAERMINTFDQIDVGKFACRISDCLMNSGPKN